MLLLGLGLAACGPGEAADSAADGGSGDDAAKGGCSLSEVLAVIGVEELTPTCGELGWNSTEQERIDAQACFLAAWDVKQASVLEATIGIDSPVVKYYVAVDGESGYQGFMIVDSEEFGATGLSCSDFAMTEGCDSAVDAECIRCIDYMEIEIACE